MNSIARKIREWRRARRMTQGELALGICTRDYLSQVENGLVVPTPDIFEKIVQRLQIAAHQLCEDTMVALHFILQAVESEQWGNAAKWLAEVNPAQLEPNGKSIYLWAKGTVAEWDKQYTEAEEYYLQSLVLAANMDNPIPLIRSLTSLGMMFCRTKQAKQALPFLQETLYLTFSDKEIDERIRITVLYAVGFMHSMLEEYESAIQYLAKAEEANRTHGLDYRRTEIYMLLANCHHRMQEYKQAERYNRLALEGLKAFPNPSMEAGIYSNLGVLYGDLKQYEEAEEILLKAITRYGELNNLHWLNNAMLELAHIYKQTGRIAEAAELCEFVLTSDPSGLILAEANLTYADVLALSGCKEEALSYLQAALRYFTEQQASEQLVKAYRLLAKINLISGYSEGRRLGDL